MQRLFQAIAGSAFVVLSFVILTPTAGAQVCNQSGSSVTTCTYNSTQGTCTAPVTGGGQDCTLIGSTYRYSSTTNNCRVDPRSCATNQRLNCATMLCECNTAAFPCGGCTAATSTAGTACSGGSCPTGGVYTNQCGGTGCPAGTTLIGGACVGYANISPASPQTGYLSVTGDIRSSSGDYYMQPGKAIRMDGAGLPTLNIGNWDPSGSGVRLSLATGGQVVLGSSASEYIAGASPNGAMYYNSTTNKFRCRENGVWVDCVSSGVSGDLSTTGRLQLGSGYPTLPAETGPTDSSYLIEGRLAAASPGYFLRFMKPSGDYVFTVRANGDTITDGFVRAAGSLSAGMTGSGLSTLNVLGGAAIGTYATTSGAPTNGLIVSGNVGIGTSSPLASLDVNGAIRIAGGTAPVSPVVGMMYYDTTLNTFRCYQGAVGAWGNCGGGAASQWTTIGANISYPTGNVGIGTDPSIRLAIGDNDTGLSWGGDGMLDLYSNNVNTMSLRASNVGIGTTSPSSQLHIASAGSPNILVQNTDDRGEATLTLSRGNTDRDKSGVYFGENDNAMRYFAGIPYNCGSVFNSFVISATDYVNNCSGVTYAPEFALSPGAATINGTFNVNGNVGIGTGSGASPLTVAAVSAQPTVSLGRASGQPTIKSDSGWLIMDSTGSGAALNYYDSANVVLANGGGNVAVGGTTASYKLDVEGVINANRGGTGTFLRADAFEAAWFDGTRFSWGYGGAENYFADEMGIGTNPDAATGLRVNGAGNGGIFSNSAGNGVAILGFASVGVRGDGTTLGVYGVSSVGYGVQGSGADSGGFFDDSNASGYAFLGYGDRGIWAAGTDSSDTIAYFRNLDAGTNSDGIDIRTGPTANPGTANNYINFRDGDATLIGQVEGNGAGGVQYTTTSDARLKENVTDYDGALSIINGMRVRQYNMIGASKDEIGFLAQELYGVYPGVVSVGADDVTQEPWGVDYGRMTPIVVRGVQELQGRLEMLEDGKVAQIDERVEKLEDRLDQLERELLELQMRQAQ